MFWKRNKLETVQELPKLSGDPFRQRLKRRFWQKRSARWSIYVLGALLFIAVFADFIANEKPIYCQYNGSAYWPIFNEYLVDLGWSTWDDEVKYLDWHKADYETVIKPIIPYSASFLDGDNTGFKKPFGPQYIRSERYRHWLGTDQLGRDIAAGLVSGTRISLAVGVISMLVATIVGLFLGLIAGYFGDRHARTTRIRLFMYVLILGYILFLAFIGLEALSLGMLSIAFLLTVLIGFIILRLVDHIPIRWLQRPITIPIDIMVTRMIEVISSFPALFTILAIVGIIAQPSIILLMAVIGLIRWTGIARFTRAEMLKVRSSGYVQSAKGLGIQDWRIIWKQALPNVLSPVLITIAFGIAGAILLESFLSFLGIGTDPSQVTWGSLLQTARFNFTNWWLALFPGLAIFVTVTVFNLIGDGLTDAMEG